MTATAQTAAPAEAPKEGDVIELSPFTVTASDSAGYQPKNTTSITGIRQELKNLPFNIEIFGEEMIKELGARDLNDVVQFATNVNGTESDGGLQRGTNFRGINSNFSRRNQFVWYNQSDSFSMGRVEIVRGPASLLYGQAEPGGLINTQSKQADVSRNFLTLQNSISDWGEFRNTIDANVHAGKRFALRVAGVQEDSDDWRDGIFREMKGYYANMHFYLTPKTKFVAEIEDVSRFDRAPRGILQWNPTAAQFTRPADAPQTGDAQIHLLGGLNNPAVANGLITKENSQSWAGMASDRDREWKTWTFSVDHQFGKHVAVEVVYNQQQQHTVLTQQQFFSNLQAPNLTNSFTYDDDWYVAVAQQYNPSRNDVKTWRARTVTTFNLAGVKNDLVLGGEHRTDLFRWQTDHERVNDGSATGGANRPAEVYLIKDGFPSAFPATPTRPVSAPDARGYVRKAFTGGRIDSEETLKAGYVVLLSQFMNGKLHTIVGHRHDDISKLNVLNGINDYVDNQGSSNAGLNYAITPQLTAYFNYSESFKAPGATRFDPNGNLLSPAIGDGKELGLKFDLFESRISGLLTFFKTDFTGDGVNIGNGSAAHNYVDPAGINGRTGTSPGWVPADTKSKGVEVQFTAEITKAWSVTFGYGYADAISKSDVIYQANFNDSYLADAAGNPLDVNGQPIIRNGVPVTKADITLNANGNQITNATALGLVAAGIKGAKVNQVTGQPTPMVTVLGGGEKTPTRNEHNVNLFTRYEFKNGALKGASVGAYARSGFNYIQGYTGEARLGNRTLKMGTDVYVAWGLWAAYTKKFDKVSWTTRVSIDNPTDDDQTLGGYNSEYWMTPRQIRWSNSISF